MNLEDVGYYPSSFLLLSPRCPHSFQRMKIPSQLARPCFPHQFPECERICLEPINGVCQTNLFGGGGRRKSTQVFREGANKKESLDSVIVDRNQPGRLARVQLQNQTPEVVASLCILRVRIAHALPPSAALDHFFIPIPPPPLHFRNP